MSRLSAQHCLWAETGRERRRVRVRWARLSHEHKKSSRESQKNDTKKDQVKTNVCEATYKDALWQKWDYLSSGDDVWGKVRLAALRLRHKSGWERGRKREREEEQEKKHFSGFREKFIIQHPSCLWTQHLWQLVSGFLFFFFNATLFILQIPILLSVQIWVRKEDTQIIPLAGREMESWDHFLCQRAAGLLAAEQTQVM